MELDENSETEERANKQVIISEQGSEIGEEANMITKGIQEGQGDIRLGSAEQEGLSLEDLTLE